jgi:hypothetical protein
MFPGADVGVTAHRYNDVSKLCCMRFVLLDMNKVKLKYFGSILLGASLSCSSLSRLSQQATPSAAQSPTPIIQKERTPELIDRVFVNDEKLSFRGYEVIKRYKKVKIPYSRGLTDVSYAVLKRGGRVLARFDGIYFGIGNATDFGLFAFLGGQTKQFVISQTIPRGGRHWVVDLSPAFRIIYDSAEWGVGREEFSVLDIDNDGRYEIFQVITAFYGFDEIPTVMETPLPVIVFKFDQRAKKYFPANHRFQDYMLSGIEGWISGLDPNDKKFYLSTRLNIVLRYIYAGKEQEAWTFFDKEYRQTDKEKIKTKVRAVLTKNQAYRFIYGSRAKLR